MRNLLIVCWAANPDNPGLCGTPFFHAAAAAAMDVAVEVYFTGASVLLLKRGVADQLYTGRLQTATVAAFMREAVLHGARFFACSQALAEHGMTLPDLIPEACGAAGAASYAARSIDENWSTCVY
jgi:hypothetical protein